MRTWIKIWSWIKISENDINKYILIRKLQNYNIKIQRLFYNIKKRLWK